MLGSGFSDPEPIDMHSRLLLSALLIGGHVLLSGAASVNRESAEPPLSPENEMIMDDPDTASACLAHATHVGETLDSAPDSAGYFHWTLGTPLITQNETWGVVCRIDFTMEGDDFSPFVNRLVLYADTQRIHVLIAIGQDLEPLDSISGHHPE